MDVPHTGPPLSEFLKLPVEEVRAIAPKTLLLNLGGTRRQAVLDGHAPHSKESALSSMHRMLDYFRLWFHVGVQHIFVILIYPPQLAETGSYAELVKSMSTYLCG